MWYRASQPVHQRTERSHIQYPKFRRPFCRWRPGGDFHKLWSPQSSFNPEFLSSLLVLSFLQSHRRWSLVSVLENFVLVAFDLDPNCPRCLPPPNPWATATKSRITRFISSLRHGALVLQFCLPTRLKRMAWATIITHCTNAVKPFATKISLISGTFSVSLTAEQSPEQFFSSHSNLNGDSDVTNDRQHSKSEQGRTLARVHSVTRAPQRHRVRWALPCQAQTGLGDGAFVVLGCSLVACIPPFFSLRPSPSATHGQLPLDTPGELSYYLGRAEE